MLRLNKVDECPLSREKELCELLSSEGNLDRSKPKAIRKAFLNYVRKNHPDKVPEGHVAKTNLVIGEFMDMYEKCVEKASDNNNELCDPKRLKKSPSVSATRISELVKKAEKSVDKKVKSGEVLLDDKAYVPETKVNMKTAECLRKTMNWSKAKPYHKFDGEKFDAEKFKDDLPKCSPKLVSLIANIEQLDAGDMKKHGKHFKHFIYTDIKAAGHGPKMVGGALAALGMKCCLRKAGKKIVYELPDDNEDIFGVLTSGTIFGESMTVGTRKQMLKEFNSRQTKTDRGNVQGEKIRFIILDSGFKEGIDLFDVKYVHMFEPQLTKADETQALGRATRLCGQKGLKFVPNEGWKLYVFKYESNSGNLSMNDLYNSYAGTDLKSVKLREQLEMVAIDSAVDRDLTAHVHNTKPKRKSMLNNLTKLLSSPLKSPRKQTVGGNTEQCKKFSCSAKNVGGRQTKLFPYSLSHLIGAYNALDATKTTTLPELPDSKASRVERREFFCKLAKENKEYCSYLVSGYTPRDDVFTCGKSFDTKRCGLRKSKVLPFTTKEMEEAFAKTNKPLPSGYKKLKARDKRLFFCNELNVNKTFCNNLINLVRPESLALVLKKDVPPIDKSNKTPISRAIVAYKSKLVVPEYTRNVLKQIEDQEKEYLYEPNKSPFAGEDAKKFRDRINRGFARFKYDPMVIENMCDLPQSSDRIVKFTPSQDFISHYFVPQSVAKKTHEVPKGMLVWHSVGTGKTCTAVATKSKEWERQGYTILWVTRTTLRADIWKNMFGKVCDYLIREKLEAGEEVPEDYNRKFLTKHFLQPVSFAQFSNACKIMLARDKVSNAKIRGQVFPQLANLNGHRDPLKKTLIIIDEAHKLLAKDLKGQEKPDFESIRDAIQLSYKKSGEESCRPLLMTATPIMDDPMDFIRLLNLLDDKQMPVDMNKFLNEYKVNSNFEFSKDAVSKFNKSMKGKISYLNRSWDPRQFTQPQFFNIATDISELITTTGECDNLDDFREEIRREGEAKILPQKKMIQEELETVEAELEEKEDELNEELQAEKDELATAGKGQITKTKQKYTLKKSQLKRAIASVKKTIKQKNTKLDQFDKKLGKLEDGADKELEKAQKKCERKEKKELKRINELTQQGVLTAKCKVAHKDLGLPEPEKKEKVVKEKVAKGPCNKRNPAPPCKDGFVIKKNKNGDDCCYKNLSKSWLPRVHKEI